MPGIWVFPGGKVELDDAGANALEQARQAAARELNEEAGIALPPESLTPFSHWLTPTLVKRRFATWFFITEVAQDLAVDVDGHEIVDYRWWEPAMAIEAHHQGTLPLTPPTLVSLHDLHSLDGAAHGAFSLSRTWPLSLRRKDHLPSEHGAHTSLRQAVVECVSQERGREPHGAMYLVSQPRSFGLTFDPISFVYCFNDAGVEAVVAEVTNTPWGERHVYVLTDGMTDDAGRTLFRAPKRLHVSPFFGMDHEYTFTLANTDRRLRLSITNRREGKRVFQAGFSVGKIASIEASGARPPLHQVLAPWRTLAGIYAQAARLAWKKAAFHPHPNRRAIRERARSESLGPGGKT